MNYFDELLAHAEATIPPDAEAPPEPRIPQIGEVWMAGHDKFVTTERGIAHNDYTHWQFVCDKPHEDQDFSYVCGEPGCRCYQ